MVNMQIERKREEIDIDRISIMNDRARKLRPEVVKQLSDSFVRVGQIQSITVRPTDNVNSNDKEFILIAGLHRLEAARAIGWASIDSDIVEGLAALDAEEIELRENVDRGDLTPIERSLHFARLKAINEERFSLKGKSHDGTKGTGTKSNTAKEIAKTTGRSATAIERDAQRAKGVPKLADAIGTSLDSGIEADALLKLPHDVQSTLIERAAKGEKVSARTETKKIERNEKEKALSVKSIQNSLTKGTKTYGVIYADPPWAFSTYSEETGMDRSADNHYPTMDHEAIAALKIPADNDCVLFLWATVPMLTQALFVMEEWGFLYKSHCMWEKDKAGTGYWFRNKHEVLLVGTKGKVPAPAPGTQFESTQFAKIERHSKKPEIFYTIIETMFPTLPKIELFSRMVRRGWSSIGNEI